MRVLFALLLLATVTACSHPLEIVGEGDITSESGDRGCTLEESVAAQANCTENYVVGAYDETYSASPRTGWDFFGWRNYCTAGDSNRCVFTVPGSTVFSFWGEPVPPLIAEFAQGTEFVLSEDNPDFVRNFDSFSLDADGIEMSVKAYVAEWNGSSYQIYGPVPTGTDLTSAGADGFLYSDVYGLILEAGPSIGISGQEFCSGGGCGFDNNQNYALPAAIIQINFAIFTFDQPVDVGSVLNGRLSSFDRDFWVASSAVAPDLNQTLGSSFSGFSVTMHNHIGGDNLATGLAPKHSNIQYLVVGAPLVIGSPLGVFPAFTSKIVAPDPSNDTFALKSLTVK